MADLAACTRVIPLSGDATLVILAGGRSSRMGRPKAELPVGDTTLLDWILGRLGPAFAETIVAGAATARDARVVADLRPDAGPLAGIEAGLRAMRTPRAFVLSCDMPRASARLAGTLLGRAARHDAAVPRTAGRAQPTCAAYARSASAKITAFLDGGGRRATAALDVLDVVYVDEPELAHAGVLPREFADLDTPADYEDFIASLRA